MNIKFALKLGVVVLIILSVGVVVTRIRNATARMAWETRVQGAMRIIAIEVKQFSYNNQQIPSSMEELLRSSDSTATRSLLQRDSNTIFRLVASTNSYDVIACKPGGLFCSSQTFNETFMKESVIPTSINGRPIIAGPE